MENFLRFGKAAEFEDLDLQQYNCKRFGTEQTQEIQHLQEKNSNFLKTARQNLKFLFAFKNSPANLQTLPIEILLAFLRTLEIRDLSENFLNKLFC